VGFGTNWIDMFSAIMILDLYGYNIIHDVIPLKGLESPAETGLHNIIRLQDLPERKP